MARRPTPPPVAAYVSPPGSTEAMGHVASVACRAGMRVGRDHVASTVNTLLLAYAGASMPLLLFFVLSMVYVYLGMRVAGEAQGESDEALPAGQPAG